jgi:hypothetical protein
MFGAVAIALIAAFTLAPRALATFNANAGAMHEVRSMQLLPPASVSAATDDACAHVTVSWPSTGADSYRVQFREQGGSWTDVPDAGSGSSIQDATGHTSTSVTYRVYTKDVSSGWESQPSPETSPLAC